MLCRRSRTWQAVPSSRPAHAIRSILRLAPAGLGEACGILGKPDLHRSRPLERSVVLPDQRIAAGPGYLRENLCERPRGADARLDRDGTRERAHGALEVGVAPLAH